MSREWTFRTLISLGITEDDAQVYVFLVEEGPLIAKDLAVALGFNKKRLYQILRNLKEKGFVKASSDSPTLFSAVLFEEVLDLSIKVRINQQEALQANKKKFLSIWRSITKNEGNTVNDEKRY